MINEWISVEDELPPCDGTYYVCNNPETAHMYSKSDFFALDYDGIGFILDNVYRQPRYWMHIPQTHKRYGKIKKD